MSHHLLYTKELDALTYLTRACINDGIIFCSIRVWTLQLLLFLCSRTTGSCLKLERKWVKLKGAKMFQFDFFAFLCLIRFLFWETTKRRRKLRRQLRLCKAFDLGTVTTFSLSLSLSLSRSLSHSLISISLACPRGVGSLTSMSGVKKRWNQRRKN